MRVISTTVTIIEISENGETKILDSNTTVEKAPVTNISGQPAEITDTFIVTQSHKAYNYISFGKNSRIQLQNYSNIIVDAPWCDPVNRRTHKTQTNRLDKMQPILSELNVNDCVKIRYTPSTSTLYFEKN